MQQRTLSTMIFGPAVLAVFFILACTTDQSTSDSMNLPCAWRVVGERAAAPEDVPFVERHPLLAESPDGNDVRGPDSTRFVVKWGTDHKASLYERSLRTGAETLIVPRGTGPRVSPDGRYLAFIYWKSTDSPWTLGILDRTTGRRIEPQLGGCVSLFPQWSPDGRWLAVMEQPCSMATRRLWIVSVPSASILKVDSLSILSDFEFSWSPNSRHLAVTSPESMDSNEEPTAADLWILSDHGRRRCRVNNTLNYVEHRPMWVTDSTLLVDRYRRERGRFVDEGRVLLTIRGGFQ